MRTTVLLCIGFAIFSVAAGQTCPPSGTLCVPQCGTQWRQCDGNTMYAVQSVPPGTICYDGAFVWPNDARCAGSTAAPTSTPTTTSKPATTTSKPATTASATTARPSTASPTNAPATTATGGSCSVADIFSSDDFNKLFPNANLAANRKDANQYPIFTYSNFVQACASYPAFACTGSTAQRKKELAAFLAQTSQETSGWWSGQDYIWGYVYSTELCGANCDPYSAANSDYPPVGGQKYYGRGPIQISWNYNYGAFSAAVLKNKNTLLNNPDLVLNNGVVAYQTALWFWMTTQAPKPSCHDVITGLWTPSSSDVAAGRVAGFGMLTNIINGGIECQTGSTPSAQSTNRVGYYTKYTGYFGIPDSTNVYCNNMQHY